MSRLGINLTQQHLKESSDMAIGAPQSTKMKVGGAVSNGPKDGVYRAIVVDVGVGESTGKSKRPYVQLEFHGKGDSDNPNYNGKRILTAKFYGAAPSDDKEKAAQMNGMLKNRLYRGFDIPWPKEGKDLDPRIFLKKEVFILLGKGKANESGDQYAEVKAIALKRDKLPRAAKKEDSAEETE